MKIRRTGDVPLTGELGTITPLEEAPFVGKGPSGVVGGSVEIGGGPHVAFSRELTLRSLIKLLTAGS